MSRARTITITTCALAAGAILATGITGIASAAGPAATGARPGTTQSTAMGHQGDGPHDGMRGGPHRDALHAEAVVKSADGAISTVRMIHGTVTAVGPSSITVKAEDGFAATYSISSTTDIHVGLPDRGHGPGDAAASTIADVKVGDVAMVEGTVAGSTVTAVEIRSMTAA